MKSRALGAFLMCPLICLITIDLSTAAESEPNAIVNDPPGADEHSKLLECQHPDYRTYIKCLRRHKRHHFHSEHDGGGGESKSKCFDDCGMDQCETTKCVHECHKRCMKKTKETRQIITQYETTCDSGDCKEERTQNLPTTNVTTNIDINNVIHNHMPNITNPVPNVPINSGPNVPNNPVPNGPNNGVPNVPNSPIPNAPTNPCTDANNPNCCVGRQCYGGWYGGYGLTLVPQIQFVPQISFGLGVPGFSGIGSGGWHQQTGGVDCSPCANPVLRYRCDVSCYANQGQVIHNTGRMPMANNGCVPPHCVGGV